MLKKLKAICSISLLISLSGCSLFSRPNNIEKYTNRELTKKLIEVSSLSKFIEEHHNTLAHTLENGRHRFSKKQYAIIKESLFESFAKEDLNSYLRKNIHSSLTRDEKIKAIKWYQSPLGKKIVKIDHFLNSQNAQKNYHDFITKINRSLPSGTQVEIAASIVRHRRYLNIYLSSIMSIQMAMKFSALAIKSNSEQSAQNQAILEAKDLALKLKGPLRNSLTINILYAYQNLTRREKIKYLDFIKNGIGKKIYRNLARIFQKSVFISVYRTSHTIERSLASEEETK